MPPRRVVADDSDEEDAPRQQAGAGGEGQDLDSLKLSDPLKTCRHLFLQSLMSRRVMRDDLAQQIYKDCVNLCKVEDAPSMQESIDALEGGLNIIGLEIRQTKDQETGKNFFILANTIQDTAAKLATEYKAEEIAFFKAIVAKIMLAREMSYCVSQGEAVKQAKQPITRVFAIQLIKSFLAKDWLSLHPTGRLILSARSLTELLPYLKETFADEDDEDVEPRDRVVVFCNYCTKIVTSGYACPNRHCGVRLHTYCAAATVGASGECPDRLKNNVNPCTQIWKKDPKTRKPTGHPVGVAALGLDDEDGAHPTSQMSDDDDDEPPAATNKKKKGAAKGKKKPAAKGKGKGKKKQDSDEEDELMSDGDEEEEEEDEDRSSAAPSSARRSSRRGSATTKRRTIQDPTSEEDDDE